MFLPTGLASLLVVLLAAVPPSSNAAPLPLPSSFDPLYLSIIPTASVINAPSEPPPRQATRSAEVNGMGGFAVAAVAASSSTPIAVQQVASTVIATVYESRIVTTTISMIKPSVESQVQQQQVIPSVASSSPIAAPPTPSSPALSTTIAPTSLPPPSPIIIVVTQTVTLPPPQPSSVVPVVDAAVQPSLAPSPLPLTRTDPQLTPVFPTTTWAQPATYSDLSSFKIKKFAVGKENFQVVQGIPAWASQGYVAPLPVATPPPSSVPSTTPDAPAEEAPAPAPVATEAPGLLDGLLGALSRRGRVAPSHPHSRGFLSSSHNHHLSLPLAHSPNHQPLIARSPPTTLSSPTFAWDNLTSSAMQVLFPSGSANPSATPVGGGDFYATPYDFSSASNMTLEYSVFFPIGFDFVKGGKLPGLYGGKEGCSGGDSAEECWSSRMMWRKEGRGEIYLYVPKDKQTPRLCSTPPQSVCDSTYGLSIGRGSFSFKTGGWTTVRQDIWMNTPGVNDGGFNIFIDGNFIFSANDVLYRNAPAPIVPPAPAPVSPSDPTTSTPSSDDSSSLSKRYNDGFYHPSPSMDDGKYHPGVVGGQSVQSEEENPSSVASATQQDVPQDTESTMDGEQTWEETEGQEHSDEVKSPASYAEEQPSSSSSSNEDDQPSSSSNDNAVEESSPSPSPTEESAPPPPAWTPSDQEIPAPPPPSPIEAPSSSSPSSSSDFTPSSSGGSSLATDDGDTEESSESDQEEQTEQDPSSTSSSDNEPTTINDDNEVSSESQQDDTPSSPPSPPSPSPPPPPPSEPTTTPPTSSPTTSTQPSPSPSAEAIPPPPPPPTNDPEQSPSPEPVPTPGDNTDGPMLGFTGIFFSTFFGGHGADWASPSDQDVWFSGFSVRTNA